MNLRSTASDRVGPVERRDRETQKDKNCDLKTKKDVFEQNQGLLKHIGLAHQIRGGGCDVCTLLSHCLS